MAYSQNDLPAMTKEISRLQKENNELRQLVANYEAGQVHGVVEVSGDGSEDPLPEIEADDALPPVDDE